MSVYGLNNAAAESRQVSQQHTLTKMEPKPENAELRKQTDAFESVILKMLMDNAMQDEKDIFSQQKDPGDKIYKSMYRDELSKASAGGFGFSQMLYDYLSQKN